MAHNPPNATESRTETISETIFPILLCTNVDIVYTSQKTSEIFFV